MLIILIAGASASGKTRLAEQLLIKLNEMGGNNLLMKMDDYYHEIPAGVDSETFRRETNFDTPDMLELSLLREHLITLASGEQITKPIFDFNTNRRIRTEIISPPDILIIEGIFALHFAKSLPEKLNKITAFVETNDYFALLRRRIERDIRERGRKDDKAVLQQERRFVGPAFFGIITSSKTYADIVVDNSMKFIAPTIDTATAHPHPLAIGVEEIVAAVEIKQTAQEHVLRP